MKPPEKGKVSIGLLLGAPKGAPEEENDKEDEDEDSPEYDEYKEELSEAFPDEQWTPERVAAMHRFVKLCGMSK